MATPSSRKRSGGSAGGLGRGENLSIEGVNKFVRPRYDAVCVGANKCVAIRTCGDLLHVLAALNIDDDELVEIVARAVCGGD